MPQDGTFEPGEIIFAPQDGAQLIVVISGQARFVQSLVWSLSSMFDDV